MDERTRRRLDRSYVGPDTAAWDRIGLERPSGWPEANMVDGRRRVVDLLLSWMSPADEPTVLDAGCGHGTTALALAARGARVTGVDRSDRLIGAARASAEGDNPRFVVGELRDHLVRTADAPAPDAILLQEVLEDYEDEARAWLLEPLRRSRTQKLFLVSRVEGGWSALLRSTAAADGSTRVLDPLALLRWIHLNTPFRFRRQETIAVRTYRAEVCEMAQDTAVEADELRHARARNAITSRS